MQELPLLDQLAVTQAGPSGSKQVYIETYGCQMNKSDSELLAGLFNRAGYRLVASPASADVILVNTCAIREHAEVRVLGRMRQLNQFKSRKPGVILGLVGCMAQHLKDKIVAMAPYIDLVAGPDSYRRLVDLVASLDGEPTLDLRLDRNEHYLDIDPLREPGGNGWVTIMRGCDKFCTFCIVPFVRGRERSIPHTEVLRQVRQLAQEGFKSVTFLGQTVNAYHDGLLDFADLLEATTQIEGIERIWFTSPHPSDFDNKTIVTIGCQPKICSHIHLPVQSGADRILAAMRRGYAVTEYRELVHQMRETIPNLSLTTDLMVGFPGETEADYLATYDLVKEIRYDSAFLFKYSPREGTSAYRSLPDDVPDQEKSRRLTALIELQESISLEINRSWIGKTVEVLVEGTSRKRSDQLYGKTENFKTTLFPRRQVQPHTLVPVHIHDATSHTLFGEIELRVKS